jgi:hypothetical protein
VGTLARAGIRLRLAGGTVAPASGSPTPEHMALIAENRPILARILANQSRCGDCLHLYPCPWSRNLAGTCPPDFTYTQEAG